VSTIAHLSLAEYDRMIEAGVFDQRRTRRLEFILGEIREMNPIGSRHEVTVDRLAEWSHESLSSRQAWVRVQNSITLPSVESAPEPDIVWCARRDYSQSRPTADDVLLVIEVAETSLAFDRGEKADLYAAAGIADYWIVNLVDRAIEVRRTPEQGRYREVRTFAGNDAARPLAAPEATLRPAMLW
jgi:Uma2 family endonuclease